MMYEIVQTLSPSITWIAKFMAGQPTPRNLPYPPPKKRSLKGNQRFFQTLWVD